MIKKEGQHLNRINEYEEKIFKSNQSIENEKAEKVLKENQTENLKIENQKLNETIKQLVRIKYYTC